MTAARTAGLYAEAVIQNVPHARTAGLYAEVVVQNHPPSRTAGLYVEIVVRTGSAWSIGSLRIK